MVCIQIENPRRNGGFLTITDVADGLQISDRTVRRWIKEGDLVSHRLGGQWRIDPRDLDTYLKIRRVA